MAQDKIINNILQSAESDAQKAISDAQAEAVDERNKINNQTEKRIKELDNEFHNEALELERRAKLNANLQERKDLLEIKQQVMKQAFDSAKERMKNLPENEWRDLIEKIVLSATITDTQYIKVPKKDMKKYTQSNGGQPSFLEQLNKKLKERGHLQKLELDKDPAHFSDGIMLIGKYSDVNASFDVLIENMKENLEWEVSQILFN